ncbi:MAG TPA: CAAX protease [Ruminococcaceae bacterium]|nr:CAAX protease [Oscillospiraceae bacterium]
MSKGYKNRSNNRFGQDKISEGEYAADSEQGEYIQKSRNKNPSNNHKAKLPATVAEQLAKLKERGCIVEDEEFAAETLTNINYFRLAHYFSLYLQEDGKYRKGTRFKDVLQVYDFDRRLRSLLMGTLEEIEIAFRAHCSNYHAIKYGATGYLSAECYSHVHNHKSFLSRIKRLIESNEDSEMVQHYIKKHGGLFPLWVIMELFSFGGLNMFYADLKPGDKMDISKKYYNTSSGDLEQKLRKMSDLRNHCAHYHRLYDWEMGDIHSSEGTVFEYILVMKELYRQPFKWRDGFLRQFRRLYFDYKDIVELSMLGFPENWLDILSEDKPEESREENREKNTAPSK